MKSKKANMKLDSYFIDFSQMCLRMIINGIDEFKIKEVFI